MKKWFKVLSLCIGISAIIDLVYLLVFNITLIPEWNQFIRFFEIGMGSFAVLVLGVHTFEEIRK